ncbi:hypothetical protein MtrunA17_Chr1g0212741 [Medicago truncatula]|uniref:DUF674 family protein n=1 Tax=Medicago truncatula TaxID=3880 RepID=A0A072W2M3_MEDTR|nr:uncharacterized protein LOC25485721 [Medicago truncatula]KEH44490.1 DUF674 family protein [Medicago truncatula]RHN82712.1 hypothetical protein MtrunA17_Chr1g0212741 [Medicago truncatula]
MASSTSSSPNKVTLKLLIDTKNDKVLFAEASKAVIDFLFNLLRLPVGTVVKLLTKNGMVGSIGNLYHSVETLSDNYMEQNQTKEELLNPIAPVSSAGIAGFLPANDADANNIVGDEVTLYYRCLNRCAYVTCDSSTRCINCSQVMAYQMDYIGKKAVRKNISTANGFVKDVVTFMVMDDLVVQPMSTISSITLLNKFNIKEVGALQEKVVEMGMDEGIKLLKASLQSKTVLTSVFIKKDV